MESAQPLSILEFEFGARPSLSAVPKIQITANYTTKTLTASNAGKHADNSNMSPGAITGTHRGQCSNGEREAYYKQVGTARSYGPGPGLVVVMAIRSASALSLTLTITTPTVCLKQETTQTSETSRSAGLAGTGLI